MKESEHRPMKGGGILRRGRTIAAMFLSLVVCLVSCTPSTYYVAPNFKTQDGVAIPREGASYDILFTFLPDENAIPSPFKYRMALGSEPGEEMTWDGGVGRMLSFTVPENTSPQERTVRVEASVGDGQGNYGKWNTIFSGTQQGRAHADIPSISALDALSDMKVGWNLGNTLDASGEWIGLYTEGKPSDYETAWGQAVTTRALIHAFAEAGFGVIRVPVTWAEHLSSDGKVEEAWMARVREVVDYVMDEGLYCILNVHHDTGTEGWLRADMDNYQAIATKFSALWTQIAEEFRDYPHRLLFEGFNEILDEKGTWNAPSTGERGYEAVNRLNQVFVSTVRSTGGNNSDRNLVLCTYAAAYGKEVISAFAVPEDTAQGHLIAEVHSYAPFEFAFDLSQDTGWWAGKDKKVFDSAARATVVGDVNSIGSAFKEKGIPVIIGEYGAANKNNIDERCLQADCYVRTGAANSIVCIHWMGLVDGKDRAPDEAGKINWTEPKLRDAIISAARETWK